MKLKSVDFSALAGKTLIDVIGAKKGSDEIRFVCSDGTTYKMHHYQDCSERVSVEDVCGDVDDLLENPILMAECVVSKGSELKDTWADSRTWTFYHISTIKGTVTLRWLGESNGYYSEEVDFEQLMEE